MRVGIVISNQDYSELRHLSVPNGDGDRIEASLEKLGFEHILRIRNASGNELQDALHSLKSELTGSPIHTIFVYYSGHGGTLEGRGDSYLLSTDFDLTKENALSTSSLKLSDLIEILEGWSASSIVLSIDACRNVVSSETMIRQSQEVQKPTLNQTPTKGLKRIVPRSSSVFISFSTKPDDVAFDAAYYSTSLAQEMLVRGLSVQEIFERVRSSVADQTNQQQIPQNEDGLLFPAWFQPEFEVVVSSDIKQVWDIPAYLYRPRFKLNPNGGGVWIQSGWWGHDHRLLLIGVDEFGQEQWRADPVSLNLPDETVLDQLEFAPDGSIYIGYHVEKDGEWPIGLARLTNSGERVSARKLNGYSASSFARIRRITFDGENGIWAAVNFGPDREYRIVRADQSLSQISEYGGLRSLRNERGMFINSMSAFSKSEIEEMDCMMRSKDKCGPIVFSAGSIRKLGQTEATIFSFEPNANVGGDDLSAHGKSYEFTWLGETRSSCCLLFGTVKDLETSVGQLLFARTNRFGIINREYTSFVPAGFDGCLAETAVKNSDGNVLAFATCRDGEANATIVVIFSPDKQVLGWNEVCDSKSCNLLDVVEAKNDKRLAIVAREERARLLDFVVDASIGVQTN
ncbi:MAG: caspase family protein [Planctomycetota bacterium]